MFLIWNGPIVYSGVLYVAVFVPSLAKTILTDVYIIIRARDSVSLMCMKSFVNQKMYNIAGNYIYVNNKFTSKNHCVCNKMSVYLVTNSSTIFFVTIFYRRCYEISLQIFGDEAQDVNSFSMESVVVSLFLYSSVSSFFYWCGTIFLKHFSPWFEKIWIEISNEWY